MFASLQLVEDSPPDSPTSPKEDSVRVIYDADHQSDSDESQERNEESALLGLNLQSKSEGNVDLDQNGGLTLWELLWTEELFPLRVFLALMFTVMLSLLILASVFHSEAFGLFCNFVHWVKQHLAAGVFVFIGAFAIGSVIFMPSMPFSLAAGYVFGKAVGHVYGVFLAALVVFVGAFIGATAAFLIGRYYLRDSVEAAITRSADFAIIDELVKTNGLKVTALVRLMHFIPYAVANYFMSFTSVLLAEYCLAHFAMLPDMFAMVFVGSTLGALDRVGDVNLLSNPVLLATFIICSLFGIVGIVVLAKVGRQEFNRMKEQLRERKLLELSTEDSARTDSII